MLNNLISCCLINQTKLALFTEFLVKILLKEMHNLVKKLTIGYPAKHICRQQLSSQCQHETISTDSYGYN